MLRKFLFALNCFKHAWKTYDATKTDATNFHMWMLEREPFRFQTLTRLRDPNAKDDGFTSLSLMKRCVNAEGEVRYFRHVPDGYELAVKETLH